MPRRHSLTIAGWQLAQADAGGNPLTCPPERAFATCRLSHVCTPISTASATAKLIQQLGGTVEGAAFAVELTFLNGRKKLNGVEVFSLIKYDK